MPNLTIAEGSPVEAAVIDVRQSYPWATPVARENLPYPFTRDYQVVHHLDAIYSGPFTREAELAALRFRADVSPLGLPYNFAIFDGGPSRIYYLNDIDQAWPHTLYQNDAIALVFFGRYAQVAPSGYTLVRAGQLLGALGYMLGRPQDKSGPGGLLLPIVGHRDTSSTECPGQALYDSLPLIRHYAKY